MKDRLNLKNYRSYKKMANNIEMNYEELANDVLEILQKQNVILQHANMDYSDQLFKEKATGLKNDQLKIIVVKDQAPADLWTEGQELDFDDYNEGAITITLDKVYDKSYKFNLMETTLNDGAIQRCVASLGRSHRDRYEIEYLKEAYSVASPVVLIAGLTNGNISPVDYAVMSKFAIDNNIAAEDSVVFVNSIFRAKMTAGTTIFQYAQNKEYKFSKGLDANTNFRNGNGFITEESGLNFFLTDKLLPSEKQKYNIGWAKPVAAPILDAATATIQTGFSSAPYQLVINVNDSVETNVKSGTVLRLGVGASNPLTDSYVRLKRDVIVPVGTGEVQTVVIDSTDLSGNLENIVQNTELQLAALSVADSSGFDAIICSNKAIALAVKAPQTIDDNQAIAVDPVTGMSLRVWKVANNRSKGLEISADSIFVAKAVLPHQIGAVKG